VKGEQGGNVFYSVVVIDTRLMVLQPFTSDKDALVKAINEATSGYSSTKLLPESDQIKSDLKRSRPWPDQPRRSPAPRGSGACGRQRGR
jgi:hypothetical protein